jgi:ABC-2 type transport system permease protein
VKLFLRQFRSELIKLFARKRTWMGFGAFVILELVVLYMFQTEKVVSVSRRDFERNIGISGLDVVFDDYFRGLTLASAIIFWTVFLLGALFLALVAGDIVSKEAEDGTLRMTLCRPVSRLRVLAVKYLACITYTFSLIVFIAATSLLLGYLWRGLGGFFVFVPEEKLFAIFAPGEGLERFAMLTVFWGLSLCTVTSLAFLFSCTSAKPAAATVITLAVMLVDRIFYMLPQFEAFKPWFLAHRMATCANIVRASIPWDKVLIDYLYLFGVNATFVIVGSAMFCRRDFKS